MDIWTAFREAHDGEPTYIGAAKSVMGAKMLCEGREAKASAYRTTIGETIVNADRSITRIPRTYSSRLVWAEDEYGNHNTTDDSVFAYPANSPEHFLIRRDTLVD